MVTSVDILTWVLVIIGGFIGGIIVFAGFYLLISSFRNWKAKRKIPNQNLGEHIKNNPDIFKDGGKKEINVKEVEEDDRKQFARFREFERLRRDAFETRVREQGTINNAIKELAKVEGRRSIQEGFNRNIGIPNGSTNTDAGNDKQDKPKRKIFRAKLE